MGQTEYKTVIYTIISTKNHHVMSGHCRTLGLEKMY